MNWLTVLFISLTTCNIALCDFYAGMFKKNDLLVAQDRIYKERVPYRLTQAKYGRLFKCPITYLRVTDRLGNPRAIKVHIIRGGLLKRLVVLRISTYDKPIAVNIYVGCENKLKIATKKTTRQPKEEKEQSTEAGNGTADATEAGEGAAEGDASEAGDEGNTEGGGGGNDTSGGPDDATEAGEETPAPE